MFQWGRIVVFDIVPLASFQILGTHNEPSLDTHKQSGLAKMTMPTLLP
jgi:hypothetical protein